jgi:hypothetical protein
MKLSFLIPFRDADGTRTRAKDWILARWQHFYPDAEFCIASDDGIDPFNKSMAVNAAAKQASGDTFVILDADSWIPMDTMAMAFRRLELAGNRWVVPARRSFRLTQGYSDQILALDPTTEKLPPLINSRATVEQAGGVVGFCHIVPREGFESVGGMDERFRGWGGEDSCFVKALDVVWGQHIKVQGTVMSLWHARPRGVGGRIWDGQTAEHYAARSALGRRYTKVRSRAEMLEVLGL